MVPQGSGGALLASGCDIAQGVDRYFSGSQEEVSYGSVRLQPLSYQDVICRLAGNSESVRSGNVKLSSHGLKRSEMSSRQDRANFYWYFKVQRGYEK